MRGNLDPLLLISEKAEAARGAEARKASFADPNGHIHDIDANPGGPAEEATVFRTDKTPETGHQKLGQRKNLKPPRAAASTLEETCE
ncbi:hypothetical protein Anapl_05872 [Anas platyrhynchos]|uniref:Uncharacterized protein n=1 Tax=Anas platyrhynchos TaxID=8839 RepID=R0M3B7_ANAPL|nr:hypothetical protein Anapl_05872 [Anas platyrhynchos]